MLEYVKEAELRVMNIFWQHSEGLTKNEIVKHCEKLQYSYKEAYVRNVVKRLEIRGFLKVSGLRKSYTRNALVYKPMVSKAEFCFYLLNPSENEAKELISLCNDLLIKL